MSKVKISVLPWSIEQANDSAASSFVALISRIEKELQESKIILLPEYCLCTALGEGKVALTERAKIIESAFAPIIQKLSKKYDALIFAGTGPALRQGRFVNQAVIFASGKKLNYAKRALTPWENSFKASKQLLLFNWKGLRIAPLICLDVELPEISVELKRKKVDLLLVASATSDELGMQRVQRCASARAVELGAVVAVAPLLGSDSRNPLVDVNVGEAKVFLPSLEAFREQSTLSSGHEPLRFDMDLSILKSIKAKGSAETRPHLVTV